MTERLITIEQILTAAPPLLKYWWDLGELGEFSQVDFRIPKMRTEVIRETQYILCSGCVQGMAERSSKSCSGLNNEGEAKIYKKFLSSNCKVTPLR